MPPIAIPIPTTANRAYNERTLPLYIQALERAGLTAQPISTGSSPQEIARIATDCSGVLLPGSPADVDPQKYNEARKPECNHPDARREMADELLLQDAYNLRKPVLSICYGLQSLNVWRSGTLAQDLSRVPVNHEAGKDVKSAHEVEIERDSLLEELLKAARNSRGDNGPLVLPVNSSHHQAAEKPGDGLRIVARCPVDNVIEALEGTSPAHWVIGVQWHPERASDPESAALFAAFAKAAESWQNLR